MIINGREYTEKQISEMEKFWRRSKNPRNASRVLDKIKDTWPEAVYLIKYDDDTQVEETLKPGDSIPQKQGVGVVSVLQKSECQKSSKNSPKK